MGKVRASLSTLPIHPLESGVNYKVRLLMAVSTLPIDAWRLIVTFAIVAVAIGIIMGFNRKNHLPVAGKVLLAAPSQPTPRLMIHRPS